MQAYEVNTIYDWEPEKIQELPAGASAHREQQPYIAYEYLDTHKKSESASGFSRYDLSSTLGIEAGY